MATTPMANQGFCVIKIPTRMCVTRPNVRIGSCEFPKSDSNRLVAVYPDPQRRQDRRVSPSESTPLDRLARVTVDLAAWRAGEKPIR